MIDLNASSSEIVVIKNADESRVNTTLATQIVTVSGKVRVAATAGNVVIAWAQNTAAGADPVAVKAGSKLIYKKV